MSDLVKSFKAFFYNQEKIADPGDVTCPPYDIISPDLRAQLRKRSPYNFIHVLLVDKKHDYDALSKKFHKWISDGVLVQDSRDCIYLYEQTFTLAGISHVRTGFLALLELDKKGVIFPHENTLSAPKKDRFTLLTKIKANLSPIFVISDRPLKNLAGLIRQCKKKKPFMDFYDSKEMRNRLWRIDDPAVIRALAKETSAKKLFIADGHHRFAVARQYFHKYKKAYKDLNYIPAYFTDPSNGLLILPTHRVAKVEETTHMMLEKLAPYFDIKEVNEDFVRRETRKEGDNFSFGIYARKKFYFLDLKNKKILDTIFVKKEEKIYKKLDVSILHKLVFKHLTVSDIRYSHKIKEVKTMVSGKKTGFLLRATPLDTVFDIARTSHLLPQKSTYFYPKLLSGLIVRRFEK